MIITLPYPPSLNTFYRTFRGRMLISKDGRAYKELTANMAKAAGMKRVTGPAVVHVDVYRPRKIGDLDNMFKGLFDSLKGIAWADDSQVVEIHARRFDDRSNPRVVVKIEPAGPVLFDKLTRTQTVEAL